MSERGRWKLALLDVTLVMFGTVLLAADGFDRIPRHLRVRLPGAEGVDGPIRSSSRVLAVTLDADEMRVEGRVVDADELVALARRARAEDKEEADVVLAAPGVAAERYLAVLAALRRAGFRQIRVPVGTGATR